MTTSPKYSLDLQCSEPIQKSITFLVTIIVFLLSFLSIFVLSNSPLEVFASENNNVSVASASFLGSLGTDDVLNAVGINTDNTIIIGGLIGASQNFGLTPTSLATISAPTAGNGAIIRLSSNGQTVLSVTRIGNEIDDISITPNGNIIATGDFGAVELNSQANSIIWSRTLSGSNSDIGDGRRSYIGNDGTIGLLGNKEVTVLQSNGAVISEFTVAGSDVNDIVVDSTNQSIIATGFTQKNGGSCTQLQVAFIRAYSYQGVLKWTKYDWSQNEAASANSSCADTRGIRLALGQDGYLYFAGETAGGNNIYRYKTNILSEDAPNIKFDDFNDTFDTDSDHITYYTKLNAVDGTQIVGQYNLARLNNGGGNTVRPRGMVAETEDNLIIVGSSAARFADRNQQQINSTPIGEYAGGDNFILSPSSDFTTRNYMTTLTNGCNALFNEVASRGGMNVAVGGTRSENCSMITVSPLQSSILGGLDGYFVIWGNNPTTNNPVVNTPSPTPTPTTNPTTSNSTSTPNTSNTQNQPTTTTNPVTTTNPTTTTRTIRSGGIEFISSLFVTALLVLSAGYLFLMKRN